MKTKVYVRVVIWMIILGIIVSGVAAFPPIGAEYYGRVLLHNGSDAPAGTEIKAYDSNGTLCGRFVVENDGYYGLLSCKGDDNETPEDEGAIAEEIISFTIDKGASVSYGNSVWEAASYKQVNITKNEPPILSYIGAQTLTEGLLYTLQVQATDADNDTLTYYANTSLFTINKTTGLISFTPNASQIGSYLINISVTDGYVFDYQIVNFTVVIRPYCGDDVCQADEDCSSCPEDCGPCPAAPPPPEAPGVGVGEAEELARRRMERRLRPDQYRCREKWECTEWSECAPEGIQTRKCTDKNNCGTTKYKPSEIQQCEYIPTCFDGIKNQGEEGVDCGGPCPPCEVIPTCFDGIKNQGEEGVDCGGPCKPCVVKYVKVPEIEKPLVLIRHFPWILLLVISILMSLTVLSDRIYVRHLSKKRMEEYRRIIRRYRIIQRWFYTIAVNVSSIILVVALYLYILSDCDGCARKYSWLLAILIVIGYLAVFMLIKHYKYDEYRKRRREQKLAKEHRRGLRKMIKLEQEMLLDMEKDVCNKIYALVEKKEFNKQQRLYEVIKPIYSDVALIRNYHKRLLQKIKTDKRTIGIIEEVSENLALAEATKKYPEFKSIIEDLKVLSRKYERNQECVEEEEMLMDDIEQITKDLHLMSIIVSNKRLVYVYNQLVDVYDYYKERRDSMRKYEKEVLEVEKRFNRKIQELTARDDLIEEIKKDIRFIRFYNILVELFEHYQREEELYREI
jgi:hypothetical protein